MSKPNYEDSLDKALRLVRAISDILVAGANETQREKAIKSLELQAAILKLENSPSEPPSLESKK